MAENQSALDTQQALVTSEDGLDIILGQWQAQGVTEDLVPMAVLGRIARLTLALPTSVQMHYLAALLLSLPQQASVNWLYSHKPANVSQAVLGLLGQHPSAPWQQEDIADKLHMSSASLRRKLAQEDTSFRQLLAEVRLCQGLTLLQNSTDSVLQIALACGYLSAEKFSARFKQAFGLTPAAYRRTL